MECAPQCGPLCEMNWIEKDEDFKRGLPVLVANRVRNRDGRWCGIQTSEVFHCEESGSVNKCCPPDVYLFQARTPEPHGRSVPYCRSLNYASKYQVSNVSSPIPRASRTLPGTKQTKPNLIEQTSLAPDMVWEPPTRFQNLLPPPLALGQWYLPTRLLAACRV